MQEYISVIYDCPNLLGMDLRSSIASIAKQSYKKIEIVLGYYGEVVPKPDYIYSECKYPTEIKYVDISDAKNKLDALECLLCEAKGDYIFFNHTGVCYSYDFIRKMLMRGKANCIARECIRDDNGSDFCLNNYLISDIDSVVFCADNAIILKDCPELIDYENRVFNKEHVLDRLNDPRLQKFCSSEEAIFFALVFSCIEEQNEIWIEPYTCVVKQEKEYVSFAKRICNLYGVTSEYLSSFVCAETVKEISHVDFKISNYRKIPCSLQTIDSVKKEIMAHDVVSFDIYDTLIQRPLWNPEDLFYILQNIITKELRPIDYIDFRTTRIDAEHLARISTINHEASLDDFYQELKRLTCYDEKTLEWIKEKELELEYKLSYQRKTGKELYDFSRWAKKTVVFTSDMYLPKSFILSVMEKNGYSYHDLFLLSVEEKQSKSNLGLYQRLTGKLKEKTIIHIGDNYTTDYQNARKCGVDSYHFPKAKDILLSTSSMSKFFNGLYKNNIGLYNAQYAFNTETGLRMLWAVVANKLFDNPFGNYDMESMFSGNFYWMGASVGGINEWAVINELIRAEREYDSIVFAARDGFLLKESIGRFVHSDKFKYCRISRKSLYPLCISRTDGLQVRNIGLVENMTPKDVFRLTDKVLACSEAEYAGFCMSMGKEIDENFKNNREFCVFGSALVKAYFSEEKYEEYKSMVKSYLDDFFFGRTLFVDMGYSGRVESILSSVFGYQIDSLYIHGKEDAIHTRTITKNLNIRSMIPFSPVENIWLRELLNSELCGSCITYKRQNDTVQPIIDRCHYNDREKAIITTYQNGVRDFLDYWRTVVDSVSKWISVNTYDCVTPFELFLTSMSMRDREAFIPCIFEDDLGMGQETTLNSLFGYVPNLLNNDETRRTVGDQSADHEGDKTVCVHNQTCTESCVVYDLLYNRKNAKLRFIVKHRERWYYKPVRFVYRIARFVRRTLFYRQ